MLAFPLRKAAHRAPGGVRRYVQRGASGDRRREKTGPHAAAAPLPGSKYRESCQRIKDHIPQCCEPVKTCRRIYTGNRIAPSAAPVTKANASSKSCRAVDSLIYPKSLAQKPRRTGTSAYERSEISPTTRRSPESTESVSTRRLLPCTVRRQAPSASARCSRQSR